MKDEKKKYFPFVGVFAAGRETGRSIENTFDSRDICEAVQNSFKVIYNATLITIGILEYPAVACAIGYYGTKFLEG